MVGQGEGAGVSWQRCQVYWCQQGCCADWKLWCHVQSRLVQLFQVCQYFFRSGVSLTGAASKHFHVTLTVSGTWSSTTVSWSVYTHCPPPDHRSSCLGHGGAGWNCDSIWLHIRDRPQSQVLYSGQQMCLKSVSTSFSSLQAHGDLVSAVDFNEDYLVTGYEDANVGVWSMLDGQQVW